MNSFSKIISGSKRKFSLHKIGDCCFYCYLQNFEIKKMHFAKMNLCKPNKNNTRKNLKSGKRRKSRKNEKIFYKIGEIRGCFLLF